MVYHTQTQKNTPYLGECSKSSCESFTFFAYGALVLYWIWLSWQLFYLGWDETILILLPGSSINFPKRIINISLARLWLAIPENFLATASVREICVAEYVRVWYRKHCHKVLNEFSDSSSLSICESRPDYFDTERVVIQSIQVSPERLPSVPEDLLRISELVCGPISVHKEVSWYLAICLSEKCLYIACKSTLRSACMMHNDIFVRIHQRSGEVFLSCGVVRFEFEHNYKGKRASIFILRSSIIAS